MLGLLVEFVEDERAESTDDVARAAFLAGVLEELCELTARIDEMNEEDSIRKLSRILASANGEFRGDPVLEHVQACIEELDRIRDRVTA
jgi:predicted nucleotidyltransferase